MGNAGLRWKRWGDSRWGVLEVGLDSDRRKEECVDVPTPVEVRENGNPFPTRLVGQAVP